MGWLVCRCVTLMPVFTRGAFEILALALSPTIRTDRKSSELDVAGVVRPHRDQLQSTARQQWRNCFT